MPKKVKKAVVIVGPTASGKTGLAVAMAAKFNGEIISADSRQVYKYMDVGTGKDLPGYNFQIPNSKSQIPISKTRDSFITHIPYHLIDVVHPNEKYDLAKWLEGAKIAINDIVSRGRLPIVAGGTGLYAQALVDGYNLSSKSEDAGLRAELEERNVEELFEILKKIDKKFAEKLNNSDKNNKRRLIRYIEIHKLSEDICEPAKKKNPDFDFLVIGIDRPMDVLREKIHKRLIDRLEKESMVDEVKALHAKHGLSWKRLESFGLEYKFIALNLQGRLAYDEMVEKLNIAIRQYAKRQMTWLRRWEKQGRLINWIDSPEKCETMITKFLA